MKELFLITVFLPNLVFADDFAVIQDFLDEMVFPISDSPAQLNTDNSDSFAQAVPGFFNTFFSG